jgi:hypothetical protein
MYSDSRVKFQCYHWMWTHVTPQKKKPHVSLWQQGTGNYKGIIIQPQGSLRSGMWHGRRLNSVSLKRTPWNTVTQCPTFLSDAWLCPRKQSICCFFVLFFWGCWLVLSHGLVMFVHMKWGQRAKPSAEFTWVSTLACHANLLLLSPLSHCAGPHCPSSRW